MTRINSIIIEPALVNAACAWASEVKQLQDLFDSPYTGAVTTRTCTPTGYKDSPDYIVVFTSSSVSSLNSYGYAQHPLSFYLSAAESILTGPSSKNFPSKPFIISLATTDVEELEEMISLVQSLRTKLSDSQTTPSRIAIELNTSCPNIGPSFPPTGYDFTYLRGLLAVLQKAYSQDPTLTLGLKMPPYVYRQQFSQALNVIAEFSDTPTGRNPISFLTCTNTLGNSLLFPEQVTEYDAAKAKEFAVPTALGGMAGEAIHTLSLGNVFSFHKLLHVERPKEYDALEDIVIIGVGGVTTKEAGDRMRKAGAQVIGAATLLGKEGVQAFEILSKE